MQAGFPEKRPVFQLQHYFMRYGEDFGKRMIKKVCIIGLDKNNLINGIRVVAIPGKNYVIQQYFSQTVQEGETIAEVLQQCYQELKAISKTPPFSPSNPSVSLEEMAVKRMTNIKSGMYQKPMLKSPIAGTWILSQPNL